MPHQGLTMTRRLMHERVKFKISSQMILGTHQQLLCWGFSKVEPMKIAELNQFIITAQHQSIKSICTGKVTVSSQKKDGATSWTLEITCVGSVSLSAKMFGGGNEKENNSGSKTSTGLKLKKAQTTTSAKVKSMLELVTLIPV
ncbi:uncharacterized protein LOC106362070 [Brassica napus]|nr:uncharacterized protein LOC106362070 [Brassica napus]